MNDPDTLCRGQLNATEHHWVQLLKPSVTRRNQAQSGATKRNQAQPSTTKRNLPQPSATRRRYQAQPNATKRDSAQPSATRHNQALIRSFLTTRYDPGEKYKTLMFDKVVSTTRKKKFAELKKALHFSAILALSCWIFRQYSKCKLFNEWKMWANHHMISSL